MAWNWELPNWPDFRYNIDKIRDLDKKFLLDLGEASAYLKTIDPKEYHLFAIEILSQEGIESSKIEGEILDRKSLQSSIQKHFGLKPNDSKQGEKEAKMAQVLCSMYETFQEPLTHQMLWQWHQTFFQGTDLIEEIGKYRTHEEPMQIVSHRMDVSKVFFEAPPSKRVHKEMSSFIDWFNHSIHSESILARAAIAHLYFENIHPFEDGNGRIGRLLIEKAFSQEIGRPVLISVSKTLEKRRKEYYSELEKCNRTLEAHHWVEFFGNAVLTAQKEAMQMLRFLIEKSKIMHALSGQINSRQEKVLLWIFAEGPSGFLGGLSADNYIAIAKTTRATATRDLADLVEKGILIKKGELRHTRYYLNLPDIHF